MRWIFIYKLSKFKKMLKLFKKNGLYGIEENGNENVPFVYEDKEGAIDEWKYFEIINISENFLPRKRSIEQIIDIEIELKNKNEYDEKTSILNFMKKNKLGFEDLGNDVSSPHEI